MECLGTKLEGVVRTRLYVTNIGDLEEIGRAFSGYFSGYFYQIRPATTTVEVSRLINSQILVELEADALKTPK